MIFVRLALRNVLRNTRRSLITVAAIAVGMAALMFMWAFIDGVNDQMIDNSTRYLAGHLQVHRKGYHDDQTLDLTLADGSAVLRLVTATGAGSATQRLEGSALASLGEKTRGIGVIGIDPAAETRVTTLDRTLAEGEFFRPGDRDGAVLGFRVAEALGARTGSEIVLVTQAADGSVGAGKYRVRGIYRTRIDMLDGAYVLLPLPAAQELYAAGDAVTSVVARLEDRSKVPALKAALEESLGAGHEVLDWQRLLPSVVQSVAFHEVMGYVLLFVLFLVVAVGITNTVLMAVMERTREFGVMMALGTGREQLVRLVFYEACALGVAGLLVGVAAGAALVQYYATTGMDFSRYTRAMQTMQGLSAIIYPLARADRAAVISLAVFGIAVVAAFYPATRAARLVPIAAIRGLTGAEPDRARPPARNGRQRFEWPLLMRIAGRGIGRNPHRSVLTIAGSAIGVAAFVFVTGLADGYVKQLVENSTGYVTGHLQVQHPLFRTEMEPANSIANASDLAAKIRSIPGVVAVAPRVQAMALANSAAQSQNFMLVGVDATAERQVTFMHRAVRQGRMLEASGNAREIVVGDRLAEKLGLRIGEKVVVMAGAVDGSVGSAAFKVAGIFDTGSDSFDAKLAFVPIGAAQELLGLGERVSAIAVKIADAERVAQLQQSIAAVTDSGQVVAVTWRDLLPEVDQMTEYLKVVLSLITGIVLGVVAIGVMNTLLMSVMERTRELGIMMALGTRPRAIVALVLYESLVLAVAGFAAGLVAGVPLVQWLNATGLDVSAYSKGLQSIPGLTGIIYPTLVPQHLLRPSALLLGLSLLAAFYPAWRAARLVPTQAIRHV